MQIPSSIYSVVEDTISLEVRRVVESYCWNTSRRCRQQSRRGTRRQTLRLEVKTYCSFGRKSNQETSYSIRTLHLQVIEKSSEAIVRQLRVDEVITDLDDQFRASSQDNGRHRYFLLPYKNPAWGQAIEQIDSIFLPAQILNEYRKVECASFSGLIPEIHRCGCSIYCILD